MVVSIPPIPHTAPPRARARMRPGALCMQYLLGGVSSDCKHAVHAPRNGKPGEARLHHDEYLVRAAKGWVACAAILDDISEEGFLAVVCGQDGDLVGRVPRQPHVLVPGHQVLSLSHILQHTPKCQNMITIDLNNGFP